MWNKPDVRFIVGVVAVSELFKKNQQMRAQFTLGIVAMMGTKYSKAKAESF